MYIVFFGTANWLRVTFALRMFRLIFLQLQELSFLEMHPDGVLLISGTQELDAGDYDCVATNEAGTSTATISLQVGSTMLTDETTSLSFHIHLL